MMKYVFVFLMLSLVGCVTPERKGPVHVSGLVINQDTLAGRDLLIKMFVGDTIVQTTFVDEKGGFRFHFPVENPGYRLEFYCRSLLPVVGEQKKIVSLSRDSVLVNISFRLRDADTTPLQKMDTFYYFGMSSAAKAAFVRSVAEKYDIYTINLGCIVQDDVNEEEVLKSIENRLGKDWLELFWRECAYRKSMLKDKEL